VALVVKEFCGYKKMVLTQQCIVGTHIVEPSGTEGGCCGWPGMPLVMLPLGMGGSEGRVITPTLEQGTRRHLQQQHTADSRAATHTLVALASILN
jgi:hypothetical protein